MSLRTHARRASAPPDLLSVIARVERHAAAADLAPSPVADDTPILDRRGYRVPEHMRPGAGAGSAPQNKGEKYPPNPPTISECMAMLRACGGDAYGRRTSASIVLMWQGALRSRCEALRLVADDLDATTGSIHIRRGKNSKQATISMAAWAWPLLDPWLEVRRALPDPDGAVLCVITGPTAGTAMDYRDLNGRLKKAAAAAGVKKRMSCHQLRHAWAVHAYSAGTPLRTIQLHLRHSNIGITDTYLQGLGLGESREQVYQQAVPMVPATELLALVGATP
jgi:integrase/recombinase XerD